MMSFAYVLFGVIFLCSAAASKVTEYTDADGAACAFSRRENTTPFSWYVDSKCTKDGVSSTKRDIVICGNDQWNRYRAGVANVQSRLKRPQGSVDWDRAVVDTKYLPAKEFRGDYDLWWADCRNEADKFVKVEALVSSAPKPIVVGIAVNQNGTIGSTQIGFLRGLKKFIEINGESGVLGRPLRLKVVDDLCFEWSADAARKGIASQKASQTLIQSDVAVVIGHLCDSSALASLSVYKQFGTLVINPAANAHALTNQEFGHVFRVVGKENARGMKMEDYWAPNPLARREARRLIAMGKADGHETDATYINAYAAIQVWASAVQASQTLDSAVLAKTMRSRDWDTVLGIIAFDRFGDVTFKDGAVR